MVDLPDAAVRRAYEKQQPADASSTLVIRRLNGVTYWVIESPSELQDYINVNIRKEWEKDLADEGKKSEASKWLGSLTARMWRLEVVDSSRVKLDQKLMSFSDDTGYNFANRLKERSHELMKEIESYGRVIPPVILRAEDFRLMDGYCRYSALKEMRVKSILAYLGYM